MINPYTTPSHCSIPSTHPPSVQHTQSHIPSSNEQTLHTIKSPSPQQSSSHHQINSPSSSPTSHVSTHPYPPPNASPHLYMIQTPTPIPKLTIDSFKPQNGYLYFKNVTMLSLSADHYYSERQTVLK
jgi:hypothetical protein